jgi:hypothetical protein
MATTDATRRPFRSLRLILREEPQRTQPGGHEPKFWKDRPLESYDKSMAVKSLPGVPQYLNRSVEE